jgi:hypothetical protein
MVIYVLFGERDNLPECFDAITEAQHGDETIEYMKERKHQIRRAIDEKEMPVLNWVPIEVDYGKLLQNFNSRPKNKGKIHPLEGIEHASIYRRNRPDGEEHPR